MKLYGYILLGIAVIVIAYFTLPMLYYWIMGKPSPVTSVSITPTTQMFMNTPASTIQYQASGTWMTALTPQMGVSFLFGMNTVQPSQGASVEDERVVWSLSKKHARDGGFTPPVPAMDVVYRPVGSMLFLRFHEPSATIEGAGAGDSVGVSYIVPLGTPPVKKQVAYFIRIRPNRSPLLGSDGILLEVYVDGLLQLTKSIVSAQLSSSGSFVVSVGDRRVPNDGLDGEIQSLSLWTDASGLVEKDIQSLASQTMNTSFDSKQAHKPTCLRQ